MWVKSLVCDKLIILKLIQLKLLTSRTLGGEKDEVRSSSNASLNREDRLSSREWLLQMRPDSSMPDVARVSTMQLLSAVRDAGVGEGVAWSMMRESDAAEYILGGPAGVEIIFSGTGEPEQIISNFPINYLIKIIPIVKYYELCYYFASCPQTEWVFQFYAERTSYLFLKYSGSFV